jgi:hypothetical protein
MPKYDYTNATIDKSNKNRIHFYEELLTILELYESVNDDVNELIGWLGVILGKYTRLPKSISDKHLNNQLEDDKKLDEYTYRRNVSVSDIRLYSLIASIIECSGYQSSDSLSEITEKMYRLLDKVVHPYHKKDLDLEEVRYYVEIQYITKEEQKELEEKHHIVFDDTEI